MKEIEENGEIMVFNDTFSNISAISCMCLSILLEDETEYPKKTTTCMKSLTSFFRHFGGDRHPLHRQGNWWLNRELH